MIVRGLAASRLKVIARRRFTIRLSGQDGSNIDLLQRHQDRDHPGATIQPS
jgi:hypothetical protein